MKTEVIEIPSSHFSSSVLSKPAGCLRGGGLIVFPTETVYGIGIRAEDSNARERLCAVKGRQKERPLTYHIAQKADLRRIVQAIPFLAKRLMDRYWPGPLTLILDSGNETVGIRFPSNPIARELIRSAGTLVIASSANLSGREPCWDGKEVRKLFLGKVDYILDGGETPLKEPSTIVKVSGCHWEMLREGIIDRQSIIRTLCMKILFVCTGNTCRSPLAEAVTKKILADKFNAPPESLAEFGFRISSAGTNAEAGSRASEGASNIAAEMGLSLSDHTTRPLSKDEAEGADIVFAMDRSNLAALRALMREESKVRLLHPKQRDIPDPFGKGEKEYRKCAQLIEKSVKEAVKNLCASQSDVTMQE